MLKVWPIASKRLLDLHKQCEPFVKNSLKYNKRLENNDVITEWCYSLSILASINIEPHVDYGSCRYTALLTYKADHTLFGKSYKYRSRQTQDTFMKKPKPPYESAQIGPGQVVLFTSTNPHWLEGTTALQAIYFDTDLTEQDELEVAFIIMMENTVKNERKNKKV